MSTVLNKSQEIDHLMKSIQEGNQTIITITDDGGGINTQKIRDRLLKIGCSAAEVAQISDTDAMDN